MNILAVIPARYGSSRMPGKPLENICGKPMIWWVYKTACEVKCLDNIVVATDDNRIYSKCTELLIPVIMTSKNCDTPTDRLCEVAGIIKANYYVMIMGDEPVIKKEAIELIINTVKPNNIEVSVLTNQIDNPAEVIDFSNQKCITNKNRDILFISRSPIPYPKGTLNIKYEKVTGVQMFTSEALRFFQNTCKSILEQAEENDLMRFIEHDIKVMGILSPYKTISVDTYKDLEIVRDILKGENLDVL